MKLGISIGHAGARMSLPLARIQRAEELGFDSVWASETYSSDAITPLAYIAALIEAVKGKAEAAPAAKPKKARAPAKPKAETAAKAVKATKATKAK